MARWWHNGLRMYAGDFSTGQVYLDHIDRYDETSWGYQEATPFEYDTPNISLGNPAKEKQFRWFTLCGAMNANTTLVITCYIDGREEFVKTITRNDIYPTELQAIAIGWDEDSNAGQIKFHPFEYVADQGMLRKKWKRIRIKITAERIGQEFYLDTLAIDAEATGNYELNDKF